MADNGSTITIGGTSKPLKEADAAWVTSQINGRGGNSVCVAISIRTEEINLNLVTKACHTGGGGGGNQRQFRAKELELIDIWNRKNLGDADFKLGHMVSFINDVKRDL